MKKHSIKELTIYDLLEVSIIMDAVIKEHEKVILSIPEDDRKANKYIISEYTKIKEKAMKELEKRYIEKAVEITGILKED